MLAMMLGVAFAAPCETTLDVTPVRQHGAHRIETASAAALSARGVKLDPRELARSLPKAGPTEDAFELQQALKLRGWDTLVFEGTPDEGARLIEAGFAPVAILDAAPEFHVLTLMGVRRMQAPDGRCVGAAMELAALDPKTGLVAWMGASEIARPPYEARMLVSFEPTAWSALDDAGFDVGTATREDRRHRASALMAKARRRPAPDEESIALLEQAVAADPAWSVPRDLLDVHRQALLDPPP